MYHAKPTRNVQNGPQTPPKIEKGNQKGARREPQGSKGAQKESKGTPKEPQSIPIEQQKQPKESRKGSQESPKGSKGSPKGPKTATNWHQKVIYFETSCFLRIVRFTFLKPMIQKIVRSMFEAKINRNTVQKRTNNAKPTYNLQKEPQ